jgi:hypothetical protein
VLRRILDDVGVARGEPGDEVRVLAGALARAAVSPLPRAETDGPPVVESLPDRLPDPRRELRVDARPERALADTDVLGVELGRASLAEAGPDEPREMTVDQIEAQARSRLVAERVALGLPIRRLRVGADRLEVGVGPEDLRQGRRVDLGR